MACAICEKRGLNHEEIRQSCTASLYKTAVFLCGFKDFSPKIHLPICKWVQGGLEQGKRHFLLMVPRSFFKTSLACAFVVWQLVRDSDKRIFYFHDSSTMSMKTLRKIQQIFNSQVFRHFFPEIMGSQKEDKRWNREEIELNRKSNHAEPSVWARGVDSSVTGGHCDIMVLDDLVGEDSHRSPLEVQRRVDFVKYSSYLFDNAERGVSIMLGTWWPGGFYEYVTGLDKYEKCVFGAYVDARFREFMGRVGQVVNQDDNEPVFPERRSADGLAKERKDSGDYSFTHQMLNLPVSDDMIRFKTEDLRYYFWGDGGDSVFADGEKFRLSDLYKTLTVDPATGESLDTDDSAITVCGYDHKSGRIFILDMFSGKLLPHALCKKIVEMHKKWRPARAGIEDASGFKVLKHFVPHEMAKQGHFFNLEPLKVGQKSKWERIVDALQPFVASRQVYFPNGQGLQLISEMTNFRVIKGDLVGRSPNLLDSLAYHVTFWKLGRQVEKDPDEIPRLSQQIRRKEAFARCQT